MLYPHLSGGRLTLVDLLGNVGVSGKVEGTSAGTLGTSGLLGGVANDGESGELGTSTITLPTGLWRYGALIQTSVR